MNKITKIGTEHFEIKYKDDTIFLCLEGSIMGFGIPIENIDEVILLLNKAKNEFETE